MKQEERKGEKNAIINGVAESKEGTEMNRRKEDLILLEQNYFL